MPLQRLSWTQSYEEDAIVDKSLEINRLVNKIRASRREQKAWIKRMEDLKKQCKNLYFDPYADSE